MDRFVCIEHVGQTFTTRKGTFVALRDINLNIAAGEFIALIGHSGCGKSTLLNLIAGREANEIILLNSHDGTSSYQMLAGMFRFVCSNGMVCGETTSDIRVRHNGDVVGDVIEGAFKVLDSFEEATTQREAMQVLTLNQGEQAAFARAALALKYDDQDSGAVPVTESQILAPRRFEDRRDDMWTTFNRVQENMMKGGLRGRNRSGRTTTTRPVNGIDQSVKLNRALWVLAEEMRRLKG